jgi:hypothetical protein
MVRQKAHSEILATPGALDGDSEGDTEEHLKEMQKVTQTEPTAIRNSGRNQTARRTVIPR